MVIEKLQFDDIPQIIELYKELVDEENNVLSLEKVYEKMYNNENYYLAVAKEGSVIMGTMLGIICNDLCISGRPFMVVESVVVSEKYRNKGIAKALMNSLERFAESRHCAYSIIVSSANRKTAHSFYEKCGYNDDVKGFRKIY